MRLLTKTAIAGGLLGIAGWIGWGLYSSRTVDTVPYEPVRVLNGYEIRRYPEAVLVETTAPSAQIAFRRLFNYITGANQREESIAMTAPVATRRGETIAMTAPVRTASADMSTDDVRMAFYLPATYSPATAPEPVDPQVELLTESEKVVAVDRFSWVSPDWRVRRREENLRSTLERAGIDSDGDAYLLRYNDPWTPPFMRRNEIVIPIVERNGA